MDLITTQQIVDNAIPGKNIDQTLLEKDIVLAEERYIETALGTDLYVKLRAGSLDVDHQKLLDDFVIPALARFVIYESMPQMHVNITSAGLVVNNTEFSDAASSKAVATSRNNMLSKAEHFRGRMIEFILDEQKEDSSKFPDYDRREDTYSNKFGPVIYETDNEKRNHRHRHGNGHHRHHGPHNNFC